MTSLYVGEPYTQGFEETSLFKHINTVMECDGYVLALR